MVGLELGLVGCRLGWLLLVVYWCCLVFGFVGGFVWLGVVSVCWSWCLVVGW